MLGQRRRQWANVYPILSVSRYGLCQSRYLSQRQIGYMHLPKLLDKCWASVANGGPTLVRNGAILCVKIQALSVKGSSCWRFKGSIAMPHHLGVQNQTTLTLSAYFLSEKLQPFGFVLYVVGLLVFNPRAVLPLELSAMSAKAISDSDGHTPFSEIVAIPIQFYRGAWRHVDL